MKSLQLAGIAATSSLMALNAFGLESNPWFIQGQEVVASREALTPESRSAKNVIFFVGDGMGISTVTASRIRQGQLAGEDGEENFLFFENFPYTALSKVYNTNQQTPDSAGTMTAMMSGVKTRAGVIGVNQYVTRGEYAEVDGNTVVSLLREAEEAGKSTGVVSTARITHATPASCYANSPERNWEDVSDMSEAAQNAGFKDIALQLIEYPYGDGIDVAMGGGRRHFLPREGDVVESDDSRRGDRTDGRDLTAEWQEAHSDGVYVWNQEQFDAIDVNSTGKVLGLFESSHMEYEHDRSGDVGGEPSITEMTEKAIDLLSKNDNGFFLMVESGRIDHAHHDTNAFRSLSETIEFAEAIEAAAAKVDLSETLIIMTADHSHVFTIAGYPERGNPILGFAGTDINGLPYTTLGYANGGSFQMTADGRPDLTDVDTTAPDFQQEVIVPMAPGSETHSGEDVGIYAVGAGADLFSGLVEQNYIYHVMHYALGLDQ